MTSPFTGSPPFGEKGQGPGSTNQEDDVPRGSGAIAEAFAASPPASGSGCPHRPAYATPPAQLARSPEPAVALARGPVSAPGSCVGSSGSRSGRASPRVYSSRAPNRLHRCTSGLAAGGVSRELEGEWSGRTDADLFHSSGTRGGGRIGSARRSRRPPTRLSCPAPASGPSRLPDAVGDRCGA